MVSVTSTLTKLDDDNNLLYGAIPHRKGLMTRGMITKLLSSSVYSLTERWLLTKIFQDTILSLT